MLALFGFCSTVWIYRIYMFWYVFIFHVQFAYTFTSKDINKRFLQVNFAVYPNTRLDDVDSDLFVLKYRTCMYK